MRSEPRWPLRIPAANDEHIDDSCSWKPKGPLWNPTGNTGKIGFVSKVVSQSVFNDNETNWEYHKLHTTSLLRKFTKLNIMLFFQEKQQTLHVHVSQG